MDALRRRVSAHLLESGATLALDCREMRRRIAHSARKPGYGDLQVLATIDLLSALKIRLGVLIMPARLPNP
jgi:hypothetical protein